MTAGRPIQLAGKIIPRTAYELLLVALISACGNGAGGQWRRKNACMVLVLILVRANAGLLLI